jgi:hypothetical protein
MVGRSLLGLRRVLASGAAARAAWLCLLLAIAATLALQPGPIAWARQLEQPSEAELKAAFLYNFVKFTEWPADRMANQKEPFLIGVLGKDPFGPALDQLVEGETLHGRPVAVRRFARFQESIGASHALFIGLSEEGSVPAILKLLDGRAILTVSEIDNFIERGGAIEIKREGPRLAFEVNLRAAQRAGLGMSAQLLRLARLVKQ